MLRHVILGLLRDGQPRHGYGLMTEYRARAGNQISLGNLYREFGRLVSEGLLQTGVNPPDADPRRIPYQITERGRQSFDQWLLMPVGSEAEIAERLVFVDHLPGERMTRLLDRWQDDLWARGKGLTKAREEALAGNPKGRFSALPSLLSRQLKHVTAELEFVKEFRLEFDAWAEQQRVLPAERSSAQGTVRGGSKRDKRSGS